MMDSPLVINSGNDDERNLFITPNVFKTDNSRYGNDSEIFIDSILDMETLVGPESV